MIAYTVSYFALQNDHIRNTLDYTARDLGHNYGREATIEATIEKWPERR